MASKVRSIQRAQEQAQAKESEIKVTLADLLNSQQALQTLAQHPLPSRLTFRLVKIVKAVAAELKSLDETKLKLFEQYGKLNTKTDSYEFPNKVKLESLNKEWSELIKTEVTIRGEQIDLEGLPGLSISAADVIVLSWLQE